MHIPHNRLVPKIPAEIYNQFHELLMMFFKEEIQDLQGDMLRIRPNWQMPDIQMNHPNLAAVAQYIIKILHDHIRVLTSSHHDADTSIRQNAEYNLRARLKDMRDGQKHKHFREIFHDAIATTTKQLHQGFVGRTRRTDFRIDRNRRIRPV